MRSLLLAAAMVPLLSCRTAPAVPPADASARVGDGARAGASIRREPEDAPDLRAILDETGFTGTVLVYRERDGRLISVHGEGADERLLPASTFKIVNALAGLEAGVVQDERTVIRWDGVVRPKQPEWNEDLDLRTAFRRSAVPHFQELARRIGPERMQRTLDRLDYGNRDISGGIDRFWLDGGLRVSPREQVELLRRLRAAELPVSPRSQETVKKLLLAEEGPGYRVYAKTGWAIRVERQVGWWVGWTERGDDVCFFATALTGDRPDPERFGPARLQVTRQVLEALGCLPSPEVGRAPAATAGVPG